MGNKVQCAINGKEYFSENAIPLTAVDTNMLAFIRQQHSLLEGAKFIGEDEYLKLKKEYLNHLLSTEYGELHELEKQVMNSISDNKILSQKVDEDYEENLTYGQRLADKIASFGGSWTFILSFFSFILVWIILNLFWLTNNQFDPFPFILLNLILSCLASIQAPIIMMSQNRQESKDRVRSEHDYKINLKAELEIQLLHKKIDHLLIHQSKRLLEIQRIQTDMTEAILKRLPEPKPE
jgi:uncharacterized membrane protein